MIIDTHAHIIVPEILREAAPAEEWRPRVVWNNGKQFIEYGSKRIGSATREFVTPETILDEIKKSGADAVLLCPWVSLVRYEAKAEESLDACQVQNDALASLVKKYPQRIAALGMIPLQDVALAIKELERLMKSGLKGVEIGTHVNGVYPGDVNFRPFWEACESLGAFVFIHPVEGGGRAELRDYYMWNVIGNPLETTVAAGHLILSGVMEAYPRLKILLAHGGGALPYLHGRLERGFKQRPEINKVISRPPTEYLKQFYFDTITHDAVVLKNLVDFVGADRILLGSDYPFDMGNENPVEFVRSTKLGNEAEKLILGDNAADIFWHR
ncbi:MAG: amidohydrolase [Chloroflexi bacterium]|nr:amidohydrolase [Chloroflexota bacterium]MBI3339685.1 amidohydrolase [Chloroflexota bacterium]